MGQPRRSLRTELLVNLGFVTSAAVILIGINTVLLLGGDLREAWRPLVALWLGSTCVFVLFGVYVVHRLVVRPLRQLASEADTLARGTVPGEAPVYETLELAALADRYRAMAEDLLDAQSHVVRVEKLAGIGRLAAGVAHEIRNPLGALGTYVDVLRRRGSDPAVTGEMHAAIGRIDRIVQGLLDYARPGATGRNGHAGGRADLNTVVRTAVEFLVAQGMLRCEALQVRLATRLEPVRGDAHALEQVVINLLVNGKQAAPDGRLTIGTVGCEFEPRHGTAARRNGAERNEAGNGRRQWAPRPRRPELKRGMTGALLYVADEGPGVPEADRERIFDPFFTTKEPGEGTGLGLAIVARTIHEAGGVVWVDRAREGGAVFKVFLPHASDADACADR